MTDNVTRDVGSTRTRPEGGCLSIVATPIGNLSDISPRAVETLRDVELVACEDTRHTGALLHALDCKVALLSLHAHNEAARLPELLTRLTNGAHIALVSDAGMPSVSDPGARLVGAAHAHGVRVEVIPGPSAVTSAIAASGVLADGFVFVGFLPRKRGERSALFDRLDGLTWPAVAFESPKRVAAILNEIATRDPARQIAICREMSKLYEHTIVGTATELATHATLDPFRGEITMVIWPPAAATHDAHSIDRLDEGIALLLDAGVSARQAADIAASLGMGARNAAYRAALAEASRRAT